MDPAKLSRQLTESFNLEELADLCFQLQIPFDEISGTNLQAKARELIQYCRRRGRLGDLIRVCQELRPNASWEVPVFVDEAPNPQFGDPIPEGQVGKTPAIPPSVSVPSVPGMFWMPYPDTWYGPFNSYYIGWMSIGGFQVWHPMMGVIPYPDPFRQFQRNIWVRLLNSPFNVFVDGGPNGYVFGQFDPL